MLLFSILIYLLFSLLVSIYFFGQLNLSKVIQVFFLILFASNLVIFEILNLLKAIGHPLLFILLQLVLCVLPSIWIIKKHPFSQRGFWSKSRIFSEKFSKFDYMLLGFIGFVLIAFFIVGITTPPNNLDSLGKAHLTGIYYWLQQGSLDSTPAVPVSIFLDPINVQIQGLWLFLLGHSENLFFLVQWFSLLVTAVTTYEVSRLLKFSTTNSLISAIVGLSLPVALLQSYSFQGDLTVATFFMVSISMTISYLFSKRKFELITALIALGLTLGTKRAGFLVLPVIGAYAFYWLIKEGKKKQWMPWLGGFLAIMLIFISFPLGRSTVRSGFDFLKTQLLAENYTSLSQIMDKVKYNTPRYVYDLIGLDGLPRVFQSDLIQTKAIIFKSMLKPSVLDLEKEVFLQPGYNQGERFGYTSPLVLSEDNSWYGPLGFILLPLSFIFSIFSLSKGRRYYSWFSFFLFVSFFFLVLLQRPGWDPYQGRYFLLAILPLVPMVSILFSSNRLLKTLLIILIIPFGLFISINTFFSNNSKPVIAASELWGFQAKTILKLPENNKLELFVKNNLVSITNNIAENALDRRNIYNNQHWDQVYYSSSDTVKNIDLIDQWVPEGETIYHNIPSSELEYGLFGKNMTRNVYKVQDISEVNSGYYLSESSNQTKISKNVLLLGGNDSYQVFFVSKP
ncbi:MAG: hypothetical protein NTZ74_10445 [Chloroflexi bacterium]|nr:hypothetical protein [Chloroflexota bacterium]